VYLRLMIKTEIAPDLTMVKTEIGSKWHNISEPVEDALQQWITTMEQVSPSDIFNDQMLATARYITKAYREQKGVRLFYYLSHEMDCQGVSIGAELTTEIAMELFLLYDWQCSIYPHSEIAFV
jgi:hypothetical protein